MSGVGGINMNHDTEWDGRYGTTEKRGPEMRVPYREEVVVHLDELRGACVEPALGAEDRGVWAEDVFVEVGYPGVDAYD